ncbi:MAG: bifunctional enoyl-CoA hydratase/phosphate acetyltransferase [Burkholderiales bacterium]|nr:bifunctional enoyl-CoA hydratase/phosphate acetyltransferase [Burkholderiales bacterium]
MSTASPSNSQTTAANDRFAALMHVARALEPIVTAVAHPCSEAALSAAVQGFEQHLIVPVLVGPRVRIEGVANQAGLDISGLRLIDTAHSHASADAAVALVRSGEAGLLMKGSLHTDELLGAVVNKDTGLRTGRRLSHVFLMDVPAYHKLLMVTDAAINIVPTLEDKRDICQNAIDLAHALGIAQPKVAILSAVETVTPRIPSTLDAAALCKMAERDQITGGLLDGPLAMDNAISAEAARIKGIRSVVAGDPDILLMPDMEAGNILAKQLTFMGQAEAAGVVLGARVPIILTSRADSVRARLASCAVAVLMVADRLAHAPLGGPLGGSIIAPMIAA